MWNKFVRLWIHCIRITCANEHCSNNYSLIWSLYVPVVRLSITLSHSTSRLLYKWSPTVAQNWDTHSIKVTENAGLYYTSRPSPLSDPLTLRKTINKSNKWRWIKAAWPNFICVKFNTAITLICNISSSMKVSVHELLAIYKSHYLFSDIKMWLSGFLVICFVWGHTKGIT